MKKVLASLAVGVLLLACGASKQQPEDTAVKWNPGDIKGNVKSIFAVSYQPAADPDNSSSVSQQENTDVILQVYNAKGELSESQWYDNDSTLTQRILFEYNASKQPTRSSYIDYHKGTPQADSSYFLYFYNSNQKLIKTETYLNGSILRWVEKEYNSSNDITLYKVYENGEPVSLTTYQYSYDSTGRKTEEKTYKDDQLTFTMSWAYDSQGRTAAVKTKDGKACITESYRYDSKNRLVEETLTSDGNSTMRITTYEYDEHDNMVEYLQKNEAGGIIECCSYTYDKHGNWIRSVDQHGATLTICERKIEYH